MKRSTSSLSRRIILKGALAPILLSGASSFAAPAAANDYPLRPIRIVVPLAAGGGIDLVTRLIGEAVAEKLGQRIIVENRPGGGNQIGAEVVAKAAPDGYTLLSASMTTYAFNPGLYAKMNYDPVKDFATISLTGRFTMVLIAHPAFPVNTVAELIAMAKDKPSTINFASSGIGSPHHFAMELLAMRAAVKLVHVPYKGAAPALQDVMGGHVPIMITDYASAKPSIDAGLVKLVAFCSPSRRPELPDVPTIAESGFPGFEVFAWQGIVAPAGTPAPIIARLNAAITGALGNPALMARLAEISIEPTPSSPETFSAYMKAEIATWREVIKTADIKVQ